MNWNGSQTDLVRSIRLIPAVLSGNHPDALGLGAIFWGFVGNAVLELVREAYLVKAAGGTGSDGIKWAPLKPATTQNKRPRSPYVASDILIETQALIDSLKPGIGQYASGAVDQVFKVEPGGVTVGTEVSYADFHQTGVPPHLPARPIVPPSGQLPTAWEPQVEAAMEQAMVKVIEAVVLGGGIQ